MQLTNQKRLAAKILKCGENRVWVNPDYIDEIASSVQADDIREFIEEGLIRAKAIKGTSRVRARTRLEQRRKGRQKGQGKRMGTSNARNPRKNRWMRTIRSQRRALKDLRDEEQINKSEYRRYYLKAKGGSYRSIAHMRSQMTLEGVKLKEGDN
ncbi:MAG: 50S ribosomal protein L19e [Euryarchaeota archaeon]|jgi:large subunit ribosomal protein L19e|nr:50S ribosomal protein L19e [Euryarchaeota archaeon]|tara:strand:- start:106 stop:567 length:462 start_codon:yes stop_codon:yes gene_type:complete